MIPLRLLLASALLLGGAPAAQAVPQPAFVKQPPALDGICSFSGWSIDPDRAGLNVRAQPSSRARVIGRLPPPERNADADRSFAVEFDVVESRGGWFRIANARRWSDNAGQRPTLPSGWISGRYLGFELQTDIAFAAPDPSSPRVATSWREQGGGGRFFRYRHPSACRGEWVRLMVTAQDGRERQAWVRGVCGSQETSCDGAGGDHIRYEDLPRRRSQ